MNSAEKEAVLHCLKAMIDEEVCEECPLYGTTGTDHCEKDCVRLAINALEQEPVMPVMYYPQVEGITSTVVEPCTDAISRQAVLNEIYNTDGISNIYFCLADKINALPPVTLAEKVGHWKRISMDMYVQHAMAYYRCSECGKDIIGEHNYCPSCGAKMQEVEE